MDRKMKKIKNNAGETIAETLVALLISALALMMLAGAVSSAFRIINESEDKMKAYYDANNSMVTQMNGGNITSTYVEVDTNQSVTLSGSGGYVKLPVGDGAAAQLKVKKFSNNVFKTKPVAYIVTTNPASGG